MTEAGIQRQIQLAMSENGVLIYRNNCGQYKAESGAVVRYGVGNPGGSDLIGITPVTITPDMVGQTVGVFTAIEVKTATGRASPAQKTFLAAVDRLGAYCGIARSAQDALKIVRKK